MVPYSLFTSESVTEGHPDKIADQISDAILDAILEKDKHARVACETLVKTGMILISGEITTHACIDFEKVARDVVKSIGYNSSDMGFDWESCAVIQAIGKQSPDIARGVKQTARHAQGAGDQGLMFGYASNETPSFMPAPVAYAHRLAEKLAHLRKDGTLPFLRPDGKTQVTVKYKEGKPVGIDAVVVSCQHAPGISQKKLREAVMELVIKPVLLSSYLDKHTRYFINPTGRFVIGGPLGDAGLTGRKVIVDTYGGMARHGGGCFSGKDPSKVDRSAAYAARYAAKNIVAAKLAERCEIQLSYAIGVAEPVSISLNTFGTSSIPEKDIIAKLLKYFDFRPRGIISMLNLLRPVYKATASYGHFGRNHPGFSWEKTDKVSLLQGQ